MEILGTIIIIIFGILLFLIVLGLPSILFESLILQRLTKTYVGKESIKKVILEFCSLRVSAFALIMILMTNLNIGNPYEIYSYFFNNLSKYILFSFFLEIISRVGIEEAKKRNL